MATNGGTLHQGLPPTPRGNLNCSQCGVLLDSVESLNVHNMHYHSEHINRWGGPPSAPNKSTSSTSSNSPTDSENNNQPKHNIHNLQHSSKSVSPLNNTISAAADSSDNQPATPQPPSSVGQESRLPYGVYNATNPTSPFQHQQQPADMHFPYINYDQYYHHHHNIEYGLPPPHFLNAQPTTQQEYKPVPSTRFHPYINHSLNPTHTNSMSPRNVSSSSPTQNSNIMQSTTSSSNPLIPNNQPTPSPSPNQCDKCGHVCETACQLSEHYATAHGSGHNESNRTVGTNEEAEIQTFPYSNYVKEEPPCDILDLDSQKMVYSPTDEPSQQGPLPSMHSLHPIQRPMMWSHDHHHAFIPPPHPQDIKPVLYSTNLPTKPDFSSSPVIKSEYIHHQTQIAHQQQSDAKPFSNDVTGNQVATSPSEFPSTTTPQENGTQFRTSFEAATSSLPTNQASGKSSSWKSNEARRPKTYNCTACNKWFTSSGHLKRHYNTTLHKNAVKSSGQPDPATLPISIHHHPTRDQNKNNHHHRGSPAQPPQPPAPPEQSRSPEYTSQYTPPLGFQQAQGFQQYGTALAMHSTTTGSPPNGQAGPSVHASQPRGLLIFLNNTGTQTVLPEQEQTFTQPITQSHTINSQEPYNITNHITINTNITTESYLGTQHQELLPQNFHIITGSDLERIDDGSENNAIDYGSMMQIENNRSISSYNTPVPYIQRRLNGGIPTYNSDTSPYSPDIPDSYHTTMCQQDRSMTPQAEAVQPPSPCSPSTTAPDLAASANNLSSNHKCVPCKKVFNKACYLTQHNKTFHSGEKPYKCAKCGKRFPCGPSHKQHLAKHGADKPFKCEQCPKQFNHKTDLRRHMCLHNGTKPYACSSCGKGFIRKDHMMKHNDTHRRKSANMAKKRGEALKLN